MLVTPKVAANHHQVYPSMISYMAQRGYITKHYIYGNKRNYAVDLDEVTLQLELGYDRKRKPLYNQNWSRQLRNKDGTFAKKTP
jgi:hypothetical protein